MVQNITNSFNLKGFNYIVYYEYNSIADTVKWLKSVNRRKTDYIIDITKPVVVNASDEKEIAYSVHSIHLRNNSSKGFGTVCIYLIPL